MYRNQRHSGLLGPVEPKSWDHLRLTVECMPLAPIQRHDVR